MDKIQVIEYHLMKSEVVQVSMIDCDHLILMFHYYIQDKLMEVINLQQLNYKEFLMLLIMVMTMLIDVHQNDRFSMLFYQMNDI